MAYENLDETEVIRRRRPSRIPWLLLILVTVASGAAIYWFRGQLELFKSRAVTAERRGALQQKTLVEVTGGREKLEAQVEELTRENAALSSDVQAKAEELAKLEKTYDQMKEKMKKEIGSGEIRLSQRGGRLQVELVDRILFNSGDTQISKRGEEVLMRVGQVLASIRDKQIQVSGHTDTAPISKRLEEQFPTNWELSTARATNVVRFLSEKAAVPERLLAATGYGPHRPVASNATRAGRARNRRIEIVLTPLIQPVWTPKARRRPMARGR